MEPWLIGMQLAMLGSFSSAVGLVLLKHSTNVEGGLPLHTRKYWLMGIVFLTLNASVIDVVAFALAPITLIAPFTGTSAPVSSLATPAFTVPCLCQTAGLRRRSPGGRRIASPLR